MHNVCSINKFSYACKVDFRSAGSISLHNDTRRRTSAATDARSSGRERYAASGQSKSAHAETEEGFFVIRVNGRRTARENMGAQWKERPRE